MNIILFIAGLVGAVGSLLSGAMSPNFSDPATNAFVVYIASLIVMILSVTGKR